MGNNDKFEKLDMLGELDEKYIEEADKYLAENSDTDMNVDLLNPEQRKFSWKTFTAAAAALMIGAVALVAVMIHINRPETNDFITPEQHAYLEEIKEKLGTELEVSYAVDKLYFTEIDLPDDMHPQGLIDKDRAVVVKEDPVTLEQTLEIYNAADKTYTVIAQLGADGKHWSIEYADKDHVLFESWSDDYDCSDELYLYDVNDGSSVLIFPEGSTDYSIRYTSTPIIADGKVYFTVSYRGYSNPTEYFIHIYDIESKTELTPIDHANYPVRYKDDVIYLSGDKDTLSVSGQNDFINSGYLYATKNGLYSKDAWSKVMEITSEKVILPSRHAMKGVTACRFACEFAVMFELLDHDSDHMTNVKFVYYEPTDEILVFREGDGFYSFTNLGWGIYVLKAEPDGTRREFIVTEEDSGNSVKIPRPDPDEYIDANILEPTPENNIPDDAVFFEDGAFVSFLPTVSAEDAFELERIDLGASEDDRIINEYNKELGYRPLEINGQQAVLGDFFDIDHNIVRLIELYYGVDGHSSGMPEWGYYDPKTRGFTSLLKCSDNEVWNVIEITDDYLIFRDGYSGAYLLIERSSLSAGGEPNIIRIGEGLTSGKFEYVIGGDGMFYFNAFDADGSNWMYSYELASGRLSKMIPNAYPALYSGELYYVDNCITDAENQSVSNGTVLRSLNSKRAFRLSELKLKTKKGIYKTRSIRINGNDYTVLYNALTDENIFGVNGYSLDARIISDSLIRISGYVVTAFGTDSPQMTVLYDIANNRVITYNSEDYFYYYGRIDGRDVVYSYYDYGKYNLYWITPK